MANKKKDIKNILAFVKRLPTSELAAFQKHHELVGAKLNSMFARCCGRVTCKMPKCSPAIDCRDRLVLTSDIGQRTFEMYCKGELPDG